MVTLSTLDYFYTAPFGGLLTALIFSAVLSFLYFSLIKHHRETFRSSHSAALLILIPLAAGMILMGTGPAYADLTDGDWQFTVDGTNATITKYNGSESVISVPSIVSDGSASYPVTAIGNSAMSYNTRLTSVTIPEGVTSIGSSVFVEDYSLASVSLPDTLTSIGASAFYHCSQLDNIRLCPLHSGSSHVKAIRKHYLNIP